MQQSLLTGADLNMEHQVKGRDSLLNRNLQPQALFLGDRIQDIDFQGIHFLGA